MVLFRRVIYVRKKGGTGKKYGEINTKTKFERFEPVARL